MKLKDWLNKENMTVIEFARWLGITRGHVYPHLREETPFSIDLAMAISRMTGGEISLQELRHYDPKKKRGKPIKQKETAT